MEGLSGDTTAVDSTYSTTAAAHANIVEFLCFLLLLGVVDDDGLGGGSSGVFFASSYRESE